MEARYTRDDGHLRYQLVGVRFPTSPLKATMQVGCRCVSCTAPGSAVGPAADRLHW